MKRWRRLSHQIPIAIFVAAVAVLIASCGGPGGQRSALPPATTASLPNSLRVEAPTSLDRSVVAAHVEVAGASMYGVIDGGWYTPDAVPGRPGFFQVDGESVPGPPDDVAPLVDVGSSMPTTSTPIPAPTPNCTTFVGAVPPPCTATGPFRRVYSNAGYSFALAHLTLPADIPTMPGGASPLNGDTGFVYLEGWTIAQRNAGNSEFGFQYSKTNNWYSPYYRTNIPHAYQVLAYHYKPSTPVTFAFAGYEVDGQSDLHVAVIGTTKESCPVPGSTATTHVCLGHIHVPDSGWSTPGCCILARMTTIAQTVAGAFYDGSVFGPIAWSGVEIAATPPPPAPGSTTLPLTGNQPPWISAGDQRWPPDQSRIVASGPGATAETDSIALNPIPNLSIGLAPASCQYLADGGSITYNVKPSSAPPGLKLAYGWKLEVPISKTTLSVPKSSPDSFTGELVGMSTKATVGLGAPGANGGYNGSIFAQLWLQDWFGRYEGYPAKSAISADAPYAVGVVKCPAPKA